MTSNRNLPLLLTLEAEDDLQHILQYSLENWGPQHAASYGQRLDNGFRNIQNHPEIGQPRDDLLPGYRLLHVERHVIIYWIRPDSINIVRILHERQDASLYF